ncbi:MAG: PP2C family protein-serine/threonine phosphatase, partial [Carbonactinosporaceae bacterium]
AAVGDQQPAAVLTQVHRSMLMAAGDGPDSAFCTLVYAILRPSGGAGGVELTLASAGHPLPRRVRADGSVEAVGTPGTLLGVLDEVDIADRTVLIDPGETVVFYTDGVLDVEVGGQAFGSQGLTRLLTATAGRSGEEVAQTLVDVAAGPDVRQRDDLAFLVLKRRGSRTGSRRR